MEESFRKAIRRAGIAGAAGIALIGGIAVLVAGSRQDDPLPAPVAVPAVPPQAAAPPTPAEAAPAEAAPAEAAPAEVAPAEAAVLPPTVPPPADPTDAPAALRDPTLVSPPTPVESATDKVRSRVLPVPSTPRSESRTAQASDKPATRPDAVSRHAAPDGSAALPAGNRPVATRRYDPASISVKFRTLDDLDRLIQAHDVEVVVVTEMGGRYFLPRDLGGTVRALPVPDDQFEAWVAGGRVSVLDPDAALRQRVSVFDGHVRLFAVLTPRVQELIDARLTEVDRDPASALVTIASGPRVDLAGG